jgi:hypothetical protein
VFDKSAIDSRRDFTDNLVITKVDLDCFHKKVFYLILVM